MAHYPADRFVRSVNKIMGDGFTVKWEKKENSIDFYKIIVFANHTGQKWVKEMLYDDFRKIPPRFAAEAAMEDLEDQMRDLVNRTTTKV